MNAITPFDFEGRAVRVVEDDAGLPWFVALDVCECLGIRNSRDAVGRLDEDERGSVGIADTSSSSRETITALAINEPGLYSLTLTSRKPEAKRFKRWITHEVLPALRRTGSYSLDAEQAEPPLPLAPQHRADQLVSAGRIFSAALRTARQLRMGTDQAMRAAFACARRHTGIDWSEELDVPLAALSEPEDALAATLAEHLAGVHSFRMNSLIEDLQLGNPSDIGLMKRIGVIARRLGWRPHCAQARGGSWYTEWRPVVRAVRRDAGGAGVKKDENKC